MWEGSGREGVRETSMWGWNMDWLPPARPVPGTEPGTQSCTLPSLELETFQCTGLCATDCATLHTSQGCEDFRGDTLRNYIFHNRQKSHYLLFSWDLTTSTPQLTFIPPSFLISQQSHIFQLLIAQTICLFSRLPNNRKQNKTCNCPSIEKLDHVDLIGE